MDTKKGIAILIGTFNEGGRETKEFEEYSKRSQANSIAHGATLLGKYGIEDNLGNGATPQVVFVIQYPSKERAIETFTSEEYKSIIPLRDVAFKEVKILISEE